jgi:hypothetical protein
MGERLDDPRLIALIGTTRGTVEWYAGEWRRALERCDEAIAIYRARCHGVSWEIVLANIFGLSALGFLGDMGRQRDRLEAALADARERGDRFAEGHFLVGQQSFCRLADDRIDEVMERVRETDALLPETWFSNLHYHRLTIAAQCHLYRGEPLAAWGEIERVWPELRKAQLLRLVLPRVELRHLRARAALALAWQDDAVLARGAATSWTKASLLRLARHEARVIRRAATKPARPLADLLDAGIAGLAHDRERERRHLEAAAEGFRAAEMRLYRDAALVRLGDLIGGSEGATVRAAAELRLAEQVARPEAIVRTLAPAC